MAEWARVVSTTITDYMKGVETRLMANQKLLAGLKKAGNITYNQAGTAFDWAVEYREAPLETTTGEDQIVPARQDRYKRPSLTMKGVRVHDMMTIREQLMNGGGRSQLINYYKEMSEVLGRNIERQFGLELYVDDSASGNSDRLTGIESMMGTNGTVTITTGAQRSANAADVAGYPSDTYAGINTGLGYYGGSWGTQSAIESTWPAGSGQLSYDFFSPTIVCFNSTAFNGSADTFFAQGQEATRYGIIHMQRYDTNSKAMKFITFDRDLYRQLVQQNDNKERFIVNDENTLRAMGFKDTLMLDGVECTWEFGVPAGVGYGFNMENMEIRSYQDRLFKVTGPKLQDLNNSWYTFITFYGNVKFTTPKHFSKFMTIAA